MPGAPQNFRATSVTERRVELEWDLPSGGGAVAGWELKRKWRGAANSPSLLLYDPDGTALTGFTDIGVIAYESSGNKDRFVYTLRAKNAEGQLGPPATVTVTVPLQPAYSPTAPTGFRLITGPRLGWIDVNWNRADWRTPAYVIQ